jgi:hypothetical protein
MSRDDPQIRAWLDQEDSAMTRMIRENGWYIQYVIGEPARKRPSIAYTIGLFGMGHPELVVLGADQGTTAGLLNEVGRRVKAGSDLVPGELLAFDEWPHRVTVEVVPNPGEILFGANRHYERPNEVSVPALQLTYDDVAGRFPWDDGYSNEPWVQPRPGTYSARD